MRNKFDNPSAFHSGKTICNFPQGWPIIRLMKIPNLVYINAISGKGIDNIEDIIRDERLVKHLWIEFILNPELVRGFRSYTSDVAIKDALTDALSWYLAFRWIFPENSSLDELHKEGVITPYKIRDTVYRQKLRSFLKGLSHAGLC